jgi:hypothetical protein
MRTDTDKVFFTRYSEDEQNFIGFNIYSDNINDINSLISTYIRLSFHFLVDTFSILSLSSWDFNSYNSETLIELDNLSYDKKNRRLSSNFSYQCVSKMYDDSLNMDGDFNVVLYNYIY